MAIKLSKALEMNFDSFKQFNIETNQKLKDAYAQNKSFKHDPILPKVDIIFESEYKNEIITIHFKYGDYDHIV